MEAKLGVLIIHGVGSHKPDFAEPMKAKLNRRISNNDVIRWEEVCWADEIENREAKLLNRLFQKDKDPHWFLKWFIRFKLRELVMSGIGDVAAYRSIPDVSGHTSTRRTNKIYDIIHKCVHGHIATLRDNLGNADKPLIVIAHSLGSVIMYDYIWDRQQHINKELYGANAFECMETLAGVITFGSPIPLFTFGYDTNVSIIFPPDNLPDNLQILKDEAKWLNFYDRDDAFAWPLKDLRKCVNKQISVGSIFTRWNILCHSKYWTDNNFIKPVAKYISEILKLCR